MYKGIREEALKLKVAQDWFSNFDCTEILGNIDFTVYPKQTSLFGRQTLLWAEAKTGDYDIATMFVQLILTIGKARTFDKALPPAFLGAFDFKKMAFVPYIAIQDIFYENDFNWNITPSNHETKEFQLIKERIERTLKLNTYVFEYAKDEKDLKKFIKNNIAKAKENGKIKINKNNFIPIYLRWFETVKPIINVNWDELKKNGIIDADFYLADLFVDDKNTQDITDDESIRDSLFVSFKNGGYTISKENIKQMFDATISIKSKDIYQAFWKHYKRPPQKQWQEYIIERRDLIVPQDIRERKGAYFTPRQWVELSQKYIGDHFGENWQDEYYIWDCASGTGNLLAGLTNKYNIWASTLDQADVNVMHERIKNGANLLESHIFQFDFLNDSFDKLPQGLQDIINDKEKRKKLIIYINPPYAEATNAKTVTGTGENKGGTATGNYVHTKYANELGRARNELFTQFLIRIDKEIPSAKIANFSKLKNLQSSNFRVFRQNFRAKLEKIFIVPAKTFDNVKGKFPIGFFIWDNEKDKVFIEIQADIYDENGEFIGIDNISSNDDKERINKWIKIFDNKKAKEVIGFMENPTPDFQNNKFLNISETEGKRHNNYLFFSKNNLIQGVIYFSVRLCMDALWRNDRKQFLYPKDGWQNDTEFQGDCLTFTLFHGQNRISSSENVNHWIPFTEQEVDAKDKFASNFMTDFIKSMKNGELKIENDKQKVLFEETENSQSSTINFQFSTEAQAVFDAGHELWKYYHSQEKANPNASLYDIREFFQGRNPKTNRMNNKSDDETYTELIGNLRSALKELALKIKPKVYEYEFLKS
ncbi:MAG: hypothetical protein CSA38_03065 [Flavobacteriales bacterium]|nr:MAG: hypothetical protein CSA38_03065 [Flavobacteriales bacterium]